MRRRVRNRTCGLSQGRTLQRLSFGNTIKVAWTLRLPIPSVVTMVRRDLEAESRQNCRARPGARVLYPWIRRKLDG